MDEFSIATLSLRPGDTVVVKVKGILSREIADRVLAAVRWEVPPGVGVLVMDDNIELSVMAAAA